MPYVIALVLLSLLLIVYIGKGIKRRSEYFEGIPFLDESSNEIENNSSNDSTYYLGGKKKNCRKKLIKSLDKSYEKIVNAYEYIDKEMRSKNDVISAAEWLLDNLYLVEKEYKDIKHNMPNSYYRDLPVIEKGMMKGFPRIYTVALDIISKNDGRVEEESIENYINQYQKSAVFTSGELWALPIMLRIALIQSIGKTIESMIFAQKEKNRADRVADRLTVSISDKKLNSEIDKLNEEFSAFTSHFIERLLKDLRDNGIDNPEIYKWIDEKLDLHDTNSEKMINIEHQKQAGFQLSMKNCINGIREVEALNWKDCFERLSYVEEILLKDPAKIYSQMDFESRDYYRHTVEKIAKKFNVTECFVSRKALECADLPKGKKYENHIGYYLVDDGLYILLEKIKVEGKGKIKFLTWINKRKVGIYVGTIVLGTVFIMSGVISLSLYKDNNIKLWRYIIAFFTLLVPCSEIVVSIFNWSINKLTEPRFIPKLEFYDEIPEKYSTIVVVPTLLNNEKRTQDLINDLEVNYLANQTKNIFFAIIGDFCDSKKEQEENDEIIINTALSGIKNLNDKYKKGAEEDIFYFFNRYRQFNKKESTWMGWERKRGKLMEFNELIRGNTNTSYNIISGNIKNLYKIKYIITLDADTQLPRDTAKKLIGAMAHIINEAHVSEDKKKVARGYGLMQPRVAVSTVSANKTLFSKIYSGETGMDIYSTAVSDVYQDLFGEGIFTGKGIYDVDIFNRMIKDEIPENSILSHDMLEGCYTRTALVSDLEVIDGYPAYYNSCSMRLHRWVRGDWQLLPWIFKKNPAINALSKWKMIDNLRRSLLAPSIVLLTLLSFKILPNGIDKWLSISLLSILIPILFDVSDEVVSPIRGISLSGRINNGKIVFEQVFLIFCFLPYQAYLMLDAILRTLYRVFISKRKLLQWQTAADTEMFLGRDLKSFLFSMWPGSAIAIFVSCLSFLKSLSTGLFFVPYCFLWFISPIIAYYISKLRNSEEIILSEEQVRNLRRISRKTWAYFEDFVSDETNWLSPDNYQEYPQNGIAFRTSPTNMAMGLTSNIVAYDLGYINISWLLERLEITLKNMTDLKKYKGHFYNWYDIKNKEPLQPGYISTVDSGNLAGYLMLVSQCLNEYTANSLIRLEQTQGLIDNLLLSNEEIDKFTGVKGFYNNEIKEIKHNNLDFVSWRNILNEIRAKLLELNKFKNNGKFFWNIKLKNFIDRNIEEIDKIVPSVDIDINMNNFCFKTSLKELPHVIENKKDELQKIGKANNELINSLKKSKKEINRMLDSIEKLKSTINDIIFEMDFSILYDKKRQLFAIGYDINKDSIGNSYYDLLASEARQASFIAIAKGDVEQKHWFKLGRAMTIIGKSRGLVSWSGTMFEYLMPVIIMKNYPDTLLNDTYKAVVEGQKKYGNGRRVPWGISESAFYNFDMNMNYQYKAFGVPGIGLKRGLANELVISPYSTVMALQIDLTAGYDNILRLINEGLEGNYGFYESIDYTKERIQKGKKKNVVRCFMIHHQGMSLMALDNVLNCNILQERFHSIPRVKATELLLQEKVPKRIIYDREHQYDLVDNYSGKQNMVVRSFNTATTEIPETELLSNGNYSVMISNSGSGYSKKGDTFLYRWREDITTDSSGMFFYIKDMGSHNYWSACYEPCKNQGQNYKVVFSLFKAEFARKDEDITTNTEIAVSNEDNAEVRRISITNHGHDTKIIEVTSYCEITLTSLNSDIVHPAFSNLFINTEFLENPFCVIGERRPRGSAEEKNWIMQTLAIDGESVGKSQVETSRANFIGRGRDLQRPQAMENESPLKNTTGVVIDPIISIRKRLKIKPGETCKIAFTTAIGESKEELIELAEKYREMNNVKRVFELSWTQAQVELNYLGIKSSQANLYQLMASKIIFINSQLRERQDYIRNIKKGQSAFWVYGISGDLPMILLIIRKDSDLDFVKQMLSAHEYWSIKGLKVDLVILNNQSTSYFQSLQDSIRDIISSSHARDKQNKAGGVFIINSSTMIKDDLEIFFAAARLVIDPEKGMLHSQMKNNIIETTEMDNLLVKDVEYYCEPEKLFEKKLEFFNEIGGFDLEENEYVIRIKDKKNTPAPWINVISNGNFGFQISESGSSYTWNKNSRENKITPWSNDWVSDASGEILYLRDEVNGKVWTLASNPIRDDSEYIVGHGFGYSHFTHEANGIIGNMKVFVPIESNEKLCIINLKNICKESRRLTLTYYAQLVKGVVAQKTSQYISTYVNWDNHYIYAKNPYNEHFSNQITFLKIIGGEAESYTGNRKEFIGRGGSISEPLAMRKDKLSNDVGAGFDPCIAKRVNVNMKGFEEKSIIIIFGEEDSIDSIERSINKFKILDQVKEELIKVKQYWSGLLNTIVVDTPDKTMNIMLNGWLMYQTVSCRLMARSAFYQSGGAYGFRDQLQDVISLCYLKPELTKQQILYSASRQFIEGDVQHWWHPVVDSGIRTRFSDDLLWLPYVTAEYVGKTGDYAILDEEVGYLIDQPLKDGEDERYNISLKAEIKSTIYEHCIKAIDYAQKFGKHNIPLMGSGDWNDGMNTVGNKGSGESVWLGWFLYSILDKFIDICRKKEDVKRLENYSNMKGYIKSNLEENAWDGNWYRRAYFDDGTPLGSLENDECQIDSISQSWAVISGAADLERSLLAMESLDRYLVKDEKGMVLLLNPPFCNSDLEPGYIKSYVPGVRENGGQYTHSVAWVVLALVKLGRGNRAWEIYNMINPINHTKSYFECEIYKAEPYVISADVYAIEPHVGRAGWSWYTGAAGWMYDVGIEGILGLKVKEGKGFLLDPCIPEEWPGFKMTYTKGSAIYNINVIRGDNKGLLVDGKVVKGQLCRFYKSGSHEVQLTI